MKKRITLLAGLALTLSVNMNATDIPMDNTQKIADVYTGATAGDVIILADGDYIVDANINMTKGITIKALNAKKATIKGAGFLFNTSGISDVTIKDLVLDGTKTIDGTLTLYVSDINGATDLKACNILFDNCNINNYGNCFLRANRAEGECASLKVNNCIFKTIGYSNAYPFFQASKTKFTTSLELTNSTIADLNNEFVQFYGTAGGNDNATILFRNNTFYNVVVLAARRPMSGNSGKIYVQNNIFVKSPVHTSASNPEVSFGTGVTTAELTNNVISDFAAGAFMSAAGWLTNTGNSEVAPTFKDATTYDFTLPEGSDLITKNIGDPRWFPQTVSKVNDVKSINGVSFNGSEITNNNGIELEVYNIIGKQVATATTSISTLDFPKGIYIVRAINTDSSFKIVCK